MNIALRPERQRKIHPCEPMGYLRPSQMLCSAANSVKATRILLPDLCLLLMLIERKCLGRHSYVTRKHMHKTGMNLPSYGNNIVGANQDISHKYGYQRIEGNPWWIDRRIF